MLLGLAHVVGCRSAPTRSRILAALPAPRGKPTSRYLAISDMPTLLVPPGRDPRQRRAQPPLPAPPTEEMLAGEDYRSTLHVRGILPRRVKMSRAVSGQASSEGHARRSPGYSARKDGYQQRTEEDRVRSCAVMGDLREIYFRTRYREHTLLRKMKLLRDARWEFKPRRAAL
jgi:hypothetical protein